MDWNYQMNDIAECGRHGTFVSWFEKLALKLTKELISEAEAKENEKNEISDNGGDDDEDGKKKKKRKPKKKKASVDTTSNKLSAMNCIITGIFESMSPEEIAQLVLRHGGKVSTNVTGLVTHMILGESGLLPPYNTPTGKGSKKYREAKKKKTYSNNRR